MLVVASHVGGLGSSPAGGTAVAGFFTISGFLMARTISENYAGAGFPRFYLNRFIRIVPPFVVVLVLTAIVLWIRDSHGFQIKPGSPQRYMPVEFPSALTTLFEWNIEGFPNYFKAQVHLAPQTWSLMLEACFYLAAPLLVMLVARRLTLVVAGIGLASLGLAVASTFSTSGSEWMRSPLATGWIFVLGLLAYFYSPLDRLGGTVQRVGRNVAILPALVVVWMAIGNLNLPEGLPFLISPLLVVCWLVLGQWSSRPGNRVDHAFGNWAYGVFLGHFLSTMLMFWTAEAVFNSTGVFGIFGIPDGPTQPLLYLSAYGFALLGGAIINYAVERPLEQLRSRVRKRHGTVPSRVSVAAPAVPLVAASE